MGFLFSSFVPIISEEKEGEIHMAENQVALESKGIKRALKNFLYMML